MDLTKTEGTGRRPRAWQVWTGAVAALVVGWGVLTPLPVAALAIAEGTAQFTNIQITPAAGAIEFLRPLWGTEVVVQAQNSLGETNTTSPSSMGDILSASTLVTWATAAGTGDATATALAGNASSAVTIPGCTSASASASGLGAITNAFRITGGTGPVEVMFAVDATFSQHLETDACGLFSSVQQSAGMTIVGPDPDGMPLFTPFPFTSLGSAFFAPNQFFSFPPETSTLFATLTLVFLETYEIRVEAQTSVEGITAPAAVPEPSTLVLLLTGGGGLLLAGGVRRGRAQRMDARSSRGA